MVNTNSSKVYTIPIDRIYPTPSQLRKVDTMTIEYEELKTSIREYGILLNIVVRPFKDGYEVIDGMHRYIAAKELGIEELECLVKESDIDELLSLQIVANSVKFETTPLEYTRQLRKIVIRYEEAGLNLSVAELSSMVCKSHTWVSNHLALERLCPSAQEALENKEICLGHALMLSRVKPHSQEEWLLSAKCLTVKQFELDVGRWLVKRQFSTLSKREMELYGTYQPRIRPLAYIVDELETLEVTNNLIVKHDITDPIEMAKHILEWVLHLDEESRKELLKNYTSQLTKDKLRAIIVNRRYSELEKIEKELKGGKNGKGTFSDNQDRSNGNDKHERGNDDRID